MSYKRKILPQEFKSGSELDNDLRAIGINLSSTDISVDPNIEDALVAGSIEAINRNSGRIASLLVDWITLHHSQINADRLTLLISVLPETEFKWVRIFWCANAQRLKDRRFHRLASLYKRTIHFDYLDRDLNLRDEPSTSFLIQRNGEDERFKNTCLRVPNRVFAHRPNQIFSAEAIARKHLAFRFRIMMGSTYRADMWAFLKRHDDAPAYAIAQNTYGSYATAHEIKIAFDIVTNAQRKAAA